MSKRICYQMSAIVADYLYQQAGLHPRLSNYRVREMVDGPRVVTLHVVIHPSMMKKVFALSDELAMALSLDKNVDVRIARGRAGALSIEIPNPQPYDVLISRLPRRRGLKATTGLDNENRPALVDFAHHTTPHLLIAGATGCGKTNAQRLFVYNLASQNEPRDVQFILIDAKKRGLGWRPFQRLPYLAHEVITDSDMALRALAWGVAEIDRRAQTGQTSPHVFIGIDEAQSILTDEAFVKPIADIASTGREFGIHLLMAMQDPKSDNLGNVTIKRNMARLVGHVDDATAAKVATGKAGSGAERLHGPGDMLLVLDSEVTRVTTALLTDRDVESLPRAETVGSLDLEQYEDIDHVLDTADNQHKAEHVAYAIAYPEASQRALYDQIHIGFPKIKALQNYVRDILSELASLGFSVCNGATGECNGATVQQGQDS